MELANNKEDQPTEAHLQVLLDYFRHSSFRQSQWKIIKSIMNDKRDNLAIMGTGSGKSLCYQYPAVHSNGVSIVISPLISLMEDQVLSLNESSIKACLLGSAQADVKKVVDGILENQYRLVYVTPEFATGESGCSLLDRMKNALNIVVIAIDEAHCVSSWGHDFRTKYRQLHVIRDKFPSVPILAVTATATREVQKDIIDLLKLKKPQVICSDCDRPNLYFEVNLKGKEPFEDLKRLMVRNKRYELQFSGPTIIYCLTRKKTEELSELLRGHGIKSMHYHAGLSINIRRNTHSSFIKDEIDVIVATLAFGMGIDKPNVRNIIHYGASNSIEAYYQEMGRASRDGQPGKCVTFYSNSDFEVHRHLREDGFTNNATTKARKEAMAQMMLTYLQTRTCRRKFIMDYFGYELDASKCGEICCDNCKYKNDNVEDGERFEGLDKNGLYDFTKDAHMFLSAIEAMGGSYGINAYVLFLRGSDSSKINQRRRQHVLFGAGAEKPDGYWKSLATLLEVNKYTEKTKLETLFTSYTTKSSKKGVAFLSEVANKNTYVGLLKLVPPPEMFKFMKVKKQFRKDFVPCTDAKYSKNTTYMLDSSKQNMPEKVKELYLILLNKRTDLAEKHNCLPYIVAQNECLADMAFAQPLSLEQLKKANQCGMTDKSVDKFGEDFINEVRKFCSVPKKLDHGSLLYEKRLYEETEQEDSLTRLVNEANKVESLEKVLPESSLTDFCEKRNFSDVEIVEEAGCRAWQQQNKKIRNEINVIPNKNDFGKKIAKSQAPWLCVKRK